MTAFRANKGRQIGPKPASSEIGTAVATPGRSARRQGATMIEFALTAPIFILVLFGTFDLGWMAYQRSALETAIVIGCRAGALTDPGVGDVDFPELQATVTDQTMTALTEVGATCDAADCTVIVESFGDSPRRNLRCSIARELDPLVGFVLGRTTLNSTMAVRMEWQR
jgi:TadE-like protein